MDSDFQQLIKRAVDKFHVSEVLDINYIVNAVELCIRNMGVSMQSRYVANLKLIVINDWIRENSFRLDPDFCVITASPIQRIKASIITISEDTNEPLS